ncbi:hypothetical protein MPH_05847 [Macrophomina phaseolina MS6]|uniref:Uncharacterized protein n=1 Tax=Macrophomina phaseolina (strain MS6) TaxID=1126212 RepID=K2R3G6_MACPH|nr:hypothetical protein MPH_05847 [Macrophomina phaseolina MS6]
MRSNHGEIAIPILSESPTSTLWASLHVAAFSSISALSSFSSQPGRGISGLFSSLRSALKAILLVMGLWSFKHFHSVFTFLCSYPRPLSFAFCTVYNHYVVLRFETHVFGHTLLKYFCLRHCTLYRQDTP